MCLDLYYLKNPIALISAGIFAIYIYFYGQLIYFGNSNLGNHLGRAIFSLWVVSPQAALVLATFYYERLAIKLLALLLLIGSAWISLLIYNDVLRVNVDPQSAVALGMFPLYQNAILAVLFGIGTAVSRLQK